MEKKNRLESHIVGIIIVQIMNSYSSQFLFGFHSELAIENNRIIYDLMRLKIVKWFDASELTDPKAKAHGGWSKKMHCCGFKALNKHLSRLPINVIIQIFKLIQLFALTFWTMQNCEIFHIVLSNFKRRICFGPICRTQFFCYCAFQTEALQSTNP